MVRSIALAAGLLNAALAVAVSSPPTIPGAYIFEFDDQQDSSSFVSSIKNHGNVRRSFDNKLFKGVSVQLDDVDTAEDTVKLLSKSKSVKSTWPVRLHSLPETTIHWTGNETSKFDTKVANNETSSPFSPHAMTQVDKLIERGYTGKGFNIAVIDTGIDYNHPALGGCFGESCLVTRGYDFVGDDYNGWTDPVPDDDPMDCEGHGSHLAGTMAAQKNPLGFTGAAPGATLSAYRVFGCFGSTADDILIAAITQAYEDGADIISLSLGLPTGWSEHPWSVIVSRMVDEGIPCTVANGNDGETGAFFASSPADGKGITAIAAVENTKTPVFRKLSSYEVDGEDVDFLYTISYRPPEKSSLPLISLSLDSEATAEGCEPFPEDTPDLSDKIVLLRAGGCDYATKSTNAGDKNAKGVIVYHDKAGLPEEPQGMPWNVTINAAVDAELGETWVELLKEDKEVTVSFPDPEKQVSSLVELDNTKTGGSVTFFSSWGPTWELDIKPQFGAPGGNVLSTFPLRKGGYSVASGTSMATPLAAAVFALLGEARGTIEPKYLESLLSATAKPRNFADKEKIHDFLSPVAQQGAGTIQAFDAAFATTLIEPSSLAFNDTDYFEESLGLTITNEGDEDVTYELSNIPSRTVLTLDPDTGYPARFPNDMVDDSAELTFNSSEITLGKGETATIDVIATPPDVDAKRLALWSGWVAINGSDGSSFSIPYQGLEGSLSSVPVMLPEKGTWLSKFNIPEKQPVPANTTFNLPPQGDPDWRNDGENVPLLITQYILGTRQVKAELVPVDSEKSIGGHTEFPTFFQQRGQHVIDWNGMLDTGEYAPPGTYRFRVKALSVRGDESKDKDWDESWTPIFSITYQIGENKTSSD